MQKKDFFHAEEFSGVRDFIELHASKMQIFQVSINH